MASPSIRPCLKNDFQHTIFRKETENAQTVSSARDDSEVWNDGTSFHQKYNF